ncbi:MAPEG family protein [Algimonas porphyrae]|uniref:Membrane protein n=1 Tax=Algimonas porphyrae TaxID=1128113 RepID=A0ABQ5UXK9_9PROT|nr:MAPEG family protein [Algimonas porphyrae]GLQ19442.1 membrane protein [Algimonas porphyrae]
MTTFQIVALYVALTLLFNPFLMLRIGLIRQKKRINLGDGGDADMLARIRTHGNFTEVAPLILIGLITMAMMNGSPLMLHIVGMALIVGRLLHFTGMNGMFGQGRFLGTILTLLAFITQGVYLLYLIFMHGPV